MAAAHVLHYGVGVPVRKVPAVLRALTGVELVTDALRAMQCPTIFGACQSTRPHRPRDGEWTAGLLF